MLLERSEIRDLLSSHYSNLFSKESTEWMKEEYPQNPNYPEQLLHKSLSGNLLRSKSEALIDMFLYMCKIPFRYECALQLGENTIYPDFTVLHPVSQEIYYWEHFGLMDNPEYAQKTFSKLQLYTAHEIYPGIRLITTYETKENPLCSEAIEKIIDYYFGGVTRRKY